MGLFDKIFGKKDTVEEIPRRIEARPKDQPREEDEPGHRWKSAKKWREDKSLEEPLIKRREFKRKY
jgi:hypothetical protein